MLPTHRYLLRLHYCLILLLLSLHAIAMFRPALTAALRQATIRSSYVSYTFKTNVFLQRCLSLSSVAQAATTGYRAQ